MQFNENDARRRTEGLLGEGFLGPDVDPEVHVGIPLPVVNPDGTQHSWFVPLAVDNKLAGFAQLLLSLVPMRVSSFQRRPGDYENCPDVADWTDAQRIAARAATLARPGEQLSQPRLTYDGNPDRLAWSIEAQSPSGEKRLLFVAGTAVYEGRASRGLI